jgi:hypothetical protein
MVEVITSVSNELVAIYTEFLNSLPLFVQDFINLFFWSILMVVYAIFIWKFYRWIAKKDLINLNLRQYGIGSNALLEKMTHWGLYFFEYIIVLPFIVFVWFAFFTLFLVLLTENLKLQTILIISVTIITAIRMTAYYREDLSRDLAKMIPLTVLGVAITQGLFSVQKVINQLFALPTFFMQIWTYLLFIMIIEFLLRFVDVLFISFGIGKKEDVEVDQ